MTHEALQKEIVSCLWSTALKRQLAEQEYIFTEMDLLDMAFHFAPTFDERLRLLQLLAEQASTVSDQAAGCITWQKKCFERFRHHGEHEVYELHIKDTPDAWDERYLCATFETALEMIDEFYKTYDSAPETEQARYVIEKRKILQSGQPFCEDRMEACVLSAGKVLISVDFPSGESKNGICGQTCPECENPCIEERSVCFPPFIPDRAPVMYRWYDGSLRHGIFLDCGTKGVGDTCYILPLDGETLRSRNYDKFWDHEHIPCPYVDSVNLASLAPELQENYRAFITWLDSRTGV